MNTSVVILAAGFGTRMKSSIPKVLHKVCGKSMLWHIINESKLISDDISVIVFNQYELIMSEFKDDNINFIIQNHKKYPGTGGALRGVKYKYNEIMVLNGDMPLIKHDDLREFIGKPSDICMGILRLDNPSGYGRVIINDNKVKGIIEDKDADTKTLAIKTVNSGVYLFKKDILDRYILQISNNNKQNEYYLTDIIKLASDDNKNIEPVYVKSSNFLGVNSKLDLSLVEDIMLVDIRKHHMQNGVTMRMPNTIYIEKSVSIKAGTVIENGVTLLGDSKIEDSIIKTNSTVEDSTIISSSIGPMARIRPNSTITNSHIGNFVEVKNSILDGVKSGHLTYLGDINIKKDTNIGAGTIICNYDGKKKYKSTIGERVFVGSNTTLISPVAIEDETMIAAGSVVNQDTNRGELIVCRAKLKVVKDFYYKFFGKKQC